MKKTQAFDYSLDFSATDFRAHPELYRIGKGEQGVLLVEPYKSEILPHWRFKTEEIAQASAHKIYGLFEEYLKNHEFAGADMARKFLQMGFTRARRYANYKGGKKYVSKPDDSKDGLPYPESQGSIHKNNPVHAQLPNALTSEKARAAEIFKKYWFRAKSHPEYLALKIKFLEL